MPGALCLLTSGSTCSEWCGSRWLSLQPSWPSGRQREFGIVPANVVARFSFSSYSRRFSRLVLGHEGVLLLTVAGWLQPVWKCYAIFLLVQCNKSTRHWWWVSNGDRLYFVFSSSRLRVITAMCFDRNLYPHAKFSHYTLFTKNKPSDESFSGSTHLGMIIARSI